MPRCFQFGNSQIRERVGPIRSDEQAHCRRGPAWRQPGGSRFVIQVSEYFLDHNRIFNAGNDPDVTATFATLIGLLEGPLLAVSRGSGY